MSARKIQRYGMLIAAHGCVFVSGCMAALERGFDMVYAPEATSNLLALSNSAPLPLAQFFARWIRE